MGHISWIGGSSTQLKKKNKKYKLGPKVIHKISIFMLEPKIRVCPNLRFCVLVQTRRKHLKSQKNYHDFIHCY